MQDILDENDVNAVMEFVEKQLENDTGTEDEKEERKAFNLIHYMTCAAAEKKRSGSLGDMSKYPIAPQVPPTWKLRMEDLNPATYSEARILRRLKEHFNIEEDEARQLTKGDLRSLYFDVCQASVGQDMPDDDELEEDEYDLPLSRKSELMDIEQQEREVKKANFEEKAVPAKDGTKVTFADVENAMKGLGAIFGDDEDDDDLEE